MLLSPLIPSTASSQNTPNADLPATIEQRVSNQNVRSVEPPPHASVRPKPGGQINFKRHIGGFDFFFGIAGLLLLLLYFVPVTTEVEWDYGRNGTEVEVDTLTFDQLDDTEPTRKNIKKQNKVNLSQYHYKRYFSMLFCLSFACFICAMLRTRGRGPAVVLISMFLLGFTVLSFQTIADWEYETKVLGREFDRDEDWTAYRTEVIAHMRLLRARWWAVDLLCALLGYRIGLTIWRRDSLWQRNGRPEQLPWILGALCILVIGLVHPMWMEWEYLYGRGENAYGFEREFWDHSHWYMAIPAALCLLAALPGRAGAAGAAIGLISFPIGQFLYSGAYWDDLIRRIWKKNDFEVSMDISELRLAETSEDVCVTLALGLIGIRMATGYWRQFWEESPTVASRAENDATTSSS